MYIYNIYCAVFELHREVEVSILLDGEKKEDMGQIDEAGKSKITDYCSGEPSPWKGDGMVSLAINQSCT